jgi:hypothetical protein
MAQSYIILTFQKSKVLKAFSPKYIGNLVVFLDYGSKALVILMEHFLLI